MTLPNTGTPGASREMYSEDANPMMGQSYKPNALAIELNSSKAISGKELSLSSWCIASLYIYHFLTVVVPWIPEVPRKTENGFHDDERRKTLAVTPTLSGDPAHQHQYITVGVNTPSSTR